MSSEPLLRQAAHMSADFYTAWRVISKDLLDYSIDPTVSNR
jgi:hypothetical protein